jgi:hypothetical protein
MMRPSESRKLGEVRETIAAIRRVDLNTADIAALSRRIQYLLHGFVVQVPIIDPGTKIYRAVKWDQQHSQVGRLSYPPADKITRFGRVNNIRQPVFYCSVGWNAPQFELRLEKGDLFALSRWRVTERLIVNNLGFTDKVFRRLQSDLRSMPQWIRRDQIPQSPVVRLLDRFFNEEFTREVSVGQEHLYKLSAAIARPFLHDVAEDEKVEGVRDNRMAGLLYPAIAALGHGDNLALKPEIVDRYLAIEQVEYNQVVDRKEDGKYTTYENKHIDFANSFGASGEIEWKGRCAQWNIVIPPGGQVQISNENGRTVYRNESGEVIDPT